MPESDISGHIFLFPASNASNAGDTGTQTAAAAAAAPLTAEAQLLERVCSGDEQAFGEFYKLYAPMVHGIILARVARDEVQDIVQDVFIAAYKNLHTLRDRNAAGAWLATIARNQVVEFYRRAKVSEELTDDFSRHDKPGTKPGTKAAEANEILAAIRTLSDTYRETLVLRLVEGMTGPEIAARTGMTPESVRVNLHRGMKMLKEKLGITAMRSEP